MNNLIKDISTLSTINEDALLKLNNLAKHCICSYVVETTLANEDNTTLIDIGIGTLAILVEDNSIKYKFIPNQEVENGIRSAVADECNPFVAKIEKTLVNKITNVYKELL